MLDDRGLRATVRVGGLDVLPRIRGALDEVSYYSFALKSDQVAYHQLADPPHFPRGRSSKAHRPVKHKPKPKPKPKHHRRAKKN
jgi:hypothetical protein